jgi:integrase
MLSTSVVLLADLLDLYTGSRECSVRYRESLRRTVRQAESAGVRSVTDLQPTVVNRFLSSLSTSATTRQNVRRELLTLWRWAFEEGMTEVPPLRVMRIKSKTKPVEAWSLQEMQRMLACAEADESRIGGAGNRKVCDWLPGWVVIAYDTGLRFSDVLALQDSNVRNGCIAGTAAKTGKALVRPMSVYAQQWADRLIRDSPDRSLFSWFLTRRRAFLSMRAFYDRHGVKGSGKYLRRACATYIEINRPGEAWRYLQHSVPTLVPRHYADASLCPVPEGPPAIR